MTDKTTYTYGGGGSYIGCPECKEESQLTSILCHSEFIICDKCPGQFFDVGYEHCASRDKHHGKICRKQTRE